MALITSSPPHLTSNLLSLQVFSSLGMGTPSFSSHSQNWGLGFTVTRGHRPCSFLLPNASYSPLVCEPPSPSAWVASPVTASFLSLAPHRRVDASEGAGSHPPPQPHPALLPAGPSSPWLPPGLPAQVSACLRSRAYTIPSAWNTVLPYPSPLPCKLLLFLQLSAIP